MKDSEIEAQVTREGDGIYQTTLSRSVILTLNTKSCGLKGKERNIKDRGINLRKRQLTNNSIKINV